MADPVLLTVYEAADVLRCSPKRVRQLVADGTLVRGPKFGKKATVDAGSVYAACQLSYSPKAPRKRRARVQSRADFDAAIEAL